MEGEMHKYLKKQGCFWLKQKMIDLSAEEVDYYNLKSIADCVGINLKKKEIRIIECKATLSDYLRDKKLFDIKKSYYSHCHYFYILCPKDIIKLEQVPKEYGLLYLNDNDTIDVIRKPTKNKNVLKTRFETSLKNTCRSVTNKFIYNEPREKTISDFQRNPLVYYSSFKCPSCKKSNKILVNKDKFNSDTLDNVKCKHCKNEFNPNISNKKIIMGFNKKFISSISKLID